MSPFIHESAIVSPNAKIGSDCYIGPFCTVGNDVQLGDGVRLDSHVVVDGLTTIGDETHVYPFASIGLAPQDLKYAGEPTGTEIGKRNHIREFVTVHRGTAGGGGMTRIGDGNLLMAQAHVAHDCQLGSEIIMANAATLAGHVEIAPVDLGRRQRGPTLGCEEFQSARRRGRSRSTFSPDLHGRHGIGGPTRPA